MILVRLTGILFFFILSIHCNKNISSGSKNVSGSNLTTLKQEIILNDKQQRILDGAKQDLKDGARYDMSMAYYVLEYRNKEFTGKKVYPEGDLDPGLGVCTDVIIRSLRNAGVVDLQEAVQKDISKNKSKYPFSRWGNKKPDSNIDHRRIMNLEVWFSNNWIKGDGENFLPGDVIVWDMNEDGASDHTGIVSDNKTGSNYFVIHNHPDPGYIAEEDKLLKWKIAGHYRIHD